eukprot:2989007-Pleurochrysis_carterae.AAC.3
MSQEPTSLVSHNELVQYAVFATTYREVHALPVESRAPVLMRNSVGKEWKPHVLVRVDDTKFAGYATAGCTSLGTTIVDGNDENGVHLDDSFKEEWNLTINEACQHTGTVR